MVDKNDSRRSFIKGAAAGLVGALLALRGAEPTQAVSRGLPIQQLSVPTPELAENLSPSDQARLEDLESRYGSDLGLSSEEEAEREALLDELTRLSYRTEINRFQNAVNAIRRARIGRGEFAIVIFPVRQNAKITYWKETVVVTRSGENLTITNLRDLIDQYTQYYEDRWGDYSS